MQYQLTNPACL